MVKVLKPKSDKDHENCFRKNKQCLRRLGGRGLEEAIILLHFHSQLGSVDDEGCLLNWAPSYSLPSEHLMAKNVLLSTLPTLGREWRLTFEINPKSYTYRSFAQVIQLTIGGKSSAVGDRTPSLWFHRTRGVYIATTLGKKASVGQFFKGKLPPTGKWTQFEIKQERKGNNFFFSFLIGDQEIWSVQNTQPREFSEVKVFAGSPWYVAQAGSIRRLQIEQKMQGKSKFFLHKLISFLQFSLGLIGAPV